MDCATPDRPGGTSTSTLLPGNAPPALRRGLFTAWLAIAAYLAWRHVFWRDEVRALSLALTGDTVIAMARAVHGEGHPLLWYLLLRAAHMIVPVREVLPAVGLIVGIAGAAFFTWRAPFRPLILVAVLFGGWMTEEYTVMARNYGISMLLIFVIADHFSRGREGPLATGGLLFLLCNTNVPSVILAGGFLLFWLVEIIATNGWRWTRALGQWVGASVICLGGVISCFLTVYPPFNEAAVSPLYSALSPGIAVAALFNLAAPFQYLWPQPAWAMPGATMMLTLLMLAAPISLARSPAGLIAAAIVLPMLLLFFRFVYPGSYRHEALYVCFVMALHWMAVGHRGGEWHRRFALPRGSIPAVAGASFSALLLLQLVPTASVLAQVAHGRVEGQSRSLAELLVQPSLRRAIVLGTPDVMVEPLPYYVANPLYLLRQHRFGTVTRFTRDAERHLTLGGILRTARLLQGSTGRPIVILIQQPIDVDDARHVWDEGILGDVTVEPGDSRAFLSATRRIAAPADLLHYGYFDERYDVYLLKPA